MMRVQMRSQTTQEPGKWERAEEEEEEEEVKTWIPQFMKQAMYLPPSLKLSGVTFKMPMTCVLVAQSKSLLPTGITLRNPSFPTHASPPISFHAFAMPPLLTVLCLNQ